MIFSNNKVKSLLGLFVSAGLLISCSENNEPQVKGANNSTFYVDALTAKFATVGEPNAQGKQSKKLISFEACLKDNAQTNSVSNLKFDIVAGEAVVSKVSDYRGCLVWYELMDFDPDAEIKNVFMARDVVAAESHSGIEKLVLRINPHKPDNDPEAFGYNRQGSVGNSTVTGPVTYMLSRDVKAKSTAGLEYDIYVKINQDVNGLLSPAQRQTEISTLKLKFQEIDYENVELDSNLNLIFPYTFKTSLAIDLIRQDLGDILAQKIKRGTFMFNLVFLKESTKMDAATHDDVVAVVKWNAKPRGDAGLIEKEIQVKFSNIAAMASRMKVLLTITSTDTPALFADQSYKGVITGVTANEDLDIELTLNENSARKLVEEYEETKSQKPVRSLSAKQVLESEGFEAISNSSVKVVSQKNIFFGKEVQSTVDLGKVIENLGENQQLTFVEEKAICAAFFQNNAQSFKDCAYRPHSILNAEIREFGTSVKGKPANISFGRTENLQISASFELTQGSTKTSGYNLDANVGGAIDGGASAKAGICSTPFLCEGKTEPGVGAKGTGANIGVGANFSIGGKGYSAKALEKTEKGAKAVSISSTEAVTSQPIIVTLDLAVTKCLLVVVNEKYIAARKIAAPKSKYLCAQSASNGRRTEYFFLLNHKRVDGNSAVTDMHSAVVNPLRMLVRGQRPYDFLKDILTSEKFSYKLFVSMNADQVTEDPTNFVTQEAPMMLSSTRKVVLGTSAKQ